MSIKNIVKTGIWKGQAQAILGPESVATGLTAAGSTQGTALALTAEINVISTAAASTGVILPAVFEVGDEFVVVNGGANALAVYPATGLSINALSANTALSLAAGVSQTFQAVTATLFVSK